MAAVTGLVIERLSVAAGGVPLLAGVDLHVDRGERVGLVGPSGIGKSTLLLAVAGLRSGRSGRVLADGQTGDALGWPAFRRRVVHVAQRPVLLDGPVSHNLRRPFEYASAGAAFPSARAAELMDRLGLGPDRFEQEARSLSVGQQQRVCLVRALLIEPLFLLLDEPTSALDPESVELVESLLEEQTRERELGALIVSHDRAQLDRWCDRAVDLVQFAVEAPA